jgi:hypothetical protein
MKTSHCGNQNRPLGFKTGQYRKNQPPLNMAMENHWHNREGYA